MAKSLFPTLVAEEKFARYKNPWKWQVEDQMQEVTEGLDKSIAECGDDVTEGIFKFQRTDHPDTIERVEQVLKRARNAR